jgi:hypothetical protein
LEKTQQKQYRASDDQSFMRRPEKQVSTFRSNAVFVSSLV